MIIHSTTLDTEAKVKAIYGSNTSWIQHSGYMLRGASSGVSSGSGHNSADGGSDTNTFMNGYYPNSAIPSVSTAYGPVYNNPTSSTQTNIPKYKSVYIGERIA